VLGNPTDLPSETETGESISSSMMIIALAVGIPLAVVVACCIIVAVVLLCRRAGYSQYYSFVLLFINLLLGRMIQIKENSMPVSFLYNR